MNQARSWNVTGVEEGGELKGDIGVVICSALFE